MSVDFIAGCIGGNTTYSTIKLSLIPLKNGILVTGAAGLIVGHPLDTVKVRLQTQSLNNKIYNGTFHALSTILKNESLTGLYRGLTSPLYGVSFVNALVFGVYGSLQPFVIGYPGNNKVWAHSFAGGITGIVQSFVSSPMELVKIRMQVLNQGKSPNAFSILRKIYNQDGLGKKGVFRGLSLTIFREIPGFASYFGSYELLIQFFQKFPIFLNSDEYVGTIGMMIAGGTAGVISWIFCFPMDVIKTRYQTDNGLIYNSIAHCWKKTYKDEGIRVFTRTLPSLLLRAFPMNAVTFPVVTWVIRLCSTKQTLPIENIEENSEIANIFQKESLNGTLEGPINGPLGELYTNQLQKKILPYHFLTPRNPTIICSQTQNNFVNLNEIIKNTVTIQNSLELEEDIRTASICPICSLGETFSSSVYDHHTLILNEENLLGNNASGFERFVEFLKKHFW